MFLKELKNYLLQHKKLALIILIPLFASIIPVSLQNKPASCAFVLIVMSLYWTTGFKIRQLFKILYFYVKKNAYQLLLPH